MEAEQRRKALSKLMSVDGNHDGVELAWNDISLSIGGKRILRNLSGVVSPGSLMCIMGAYCLLTPYAARWLGVLTPAVSVPLQVRLVQASRPC